ncbi:hypothetical protein AVDCRST_MAG81-2692 [uncultured Synechococcales cyanobacterium]|uniref:DUF2993 domain-containing protein n=1 Tax=uncultured Synechococcales cyanobacterium TaxID=1936017 RepID=A0A6J4VNV6_9CYAN|nr:hypothetical protein AVDCRST_MAG81-2692 [uncultured Synechococcales cyanobacterium]
MPQEERGLGEQALNKAAEIGLSSQLDQVEELEVDVQTNPLSAVQGNVDSVSIEGKGMVMQGDLRVEELQVNTGSVKLNGMSAAFGKIELEQPTDATTHVVLTEQDITRAFNSEFIHTKLQNLEVNVDGKPTTVDIQEVKFQLPGNGIKLNAQIRLQDTGETKPVSFTATPRMSPDGERIILEDIQDQEGKDLSPELTDALSEKASELLNLRNFQLEGMSFRLQGLDVQQGRLTLQAETHVEKFPLSEE